MLRAEIWGNLDPLLALGCQRGIKTAQEMLCLSSFAWQVPWCGSTCPTPVQSQVSPDLPAGLDALAHRLEWASYPWYLNFGSFGFWLSHSGSSRGGCDEPFGNNPLGPAVREILGCPGSVIVCPSWGFVLTTAIVANSDTVFSYPSMGHWLINIVGSSKTDNLFSLKHSVFKEYFPLLSW